MLLAAYFYKPIDYSMSDVVNNAQCAFTYQHSFCVPILGWAKLPDQWKARSMKNLQSQKVFKHMTTKLVGEHANYWNTLYYPPPPLAVEE